MKNTRPRQEAGSAGDDDRRNIPYLRARPRPRSFYVEQQWSNFWRLRAAERYLAELLWFRHCLENPSVRRA